MNFVRKPLNSPPDPPRNFLFFFSLSNSRLWNMEFLQLSETTRAREVDAVLKRNEWLDPIRAWVAPGPLLDIFLFFSKTKIFHSHPWYCYKIILKTVSVLDSDLYWIWGGKKEKKLLVLNTVVTIIIMVTVFTILCVQLEDYQSVFSTFKPMSALTQDWDIYVVTALAILLGLLIVLRRHR